MYLFSRSIRAVETLKDTPYAPFKALARVLVKTSTEILRVEAYIKGGHFFGCWDALSFG